MRPKARFNFDRWALVVLVGAALCLGIWRWWAEHPGDNPWAPLRLRDPIGWATRSKLAHLRDKPGECQAFLSRSAIGFTALPPEGEGACLRADRMIAVPDKATGFVLHPAGAQASCTINAGLALWLRHGIQPAARRFLHARVVALEHLGTYNCRKIGGGVKGHWSQHATGNAIDIAGFVLSDGRRISVLHDWPGDDAVALFLQAARDSSCDVFSTVLSPDYNAAHRDHLHLDQAARGGFRVCR